MKVSTIIPRRTVLLIALLLSCAIGLSAAQLMQWKPTPMAKIGTKRALQEGKSSVFYYRSVLGSPLDFGILDQSKIRISVFTKKDSIKFKYTVIVDKEKKNYEVHYRRKVGNYYCFEDIYLSLLPGKHKIKITTSNRNAYFRAFYPVFKKVYPPISLAKPSTATDTIHLNKGVTSKSYYIATVDKPFQTIVTDKYKVYGYARASLVNKTTASFEIYRNGVFLKKIDISAKKTKLYRNVKYPNISIGKKFEVPLIAGKNVIVLKPVGSNPVIFRIFKERKATP